MAVALSSPGVTFHLHSPASTPSSNRFLFRNQNASPVVLSLSTHRSSRSVLVFARGKNRKGFTSSSSPKKNKKKTFGGDASGGGEEAEEDDPFEALFNLLEEDLNNDKSSIDDEEISEEDLDRLAAELAEVLGGGDDVDGIDLFGSATGDVVDDEDDGQDDNDIEDDDEEDDSEEEDERPVKLKNWQLRRLAYALKAGRRKTSIKNLAAELCLDRAYVLELLRDPPPKLLMLSATLPDEKPPVAAPENSSSPDANPLESSSSAEDAVEVKPEEKVKEEAVHVMQQRWSAQKRVKKAHIETLEKVYRRSKRPTNAVVSSIVQVTNLPRRRVLKWFEDRRAEDGVPEKRAPYQAPV
ncbi:hypothetical protein N665_0025s0305 [Sinapis alba]|nr:hypothetical protein N665_0025s0305 [Sinapis alba]